MIEITVENDSMTWPLPNGLPASKKEIYIYRYTSLTKKTCNCDVLPFVLVLLHGYKA